MTRKTELGVLAVVVLSCLTAGCAIRQGDLTMVSTRNVYLDKVDIDSLPQVSNITGKASRMVILVIPLGYPKLEEAIDDALIKGGGDLMVDAVVYNRSWWFIVGETAIEVKGTVVKTRGIDR